MLLMSCEEKVFKDSVDCENECYTIKPDSVDLIFHWTMNDEFNEIPILLYQGTIEEGAFIDTFYLFANPAYVYVKAGKTYSVKALYEQDGKSTWVVDGTHQKLKKVSDYCEQGDCWVVENADLYIELKYY
jgi:hypothetical protein